MLVLFELSDMMLEVAMTSVRGGNVGIVDARKPIEQAQTLGGVERHEAFVLRVDGGEKGRELLEYTHGCRLIIDEDAGLAAGSNFATQDELIAIDVETIGVEHGGERFLTSFEDAGDNSLLGAMTDDVRGGAIAEQKAQRVNQDGLPCSGFASEQIQTRAELDFHAVNDGVIFNLELEEQVFPCSWAQDSTGAERERDGIEL